MNIIELVKQTLTEFPRISEMNYGLNVDFTEDTPGNCGLYPTGDQLIKEDILGNQDRRHNFVLYAVFQSFTDYDRLANSTFFIGLGLLARASSHWSDNRGNYKRADCNRHVKETQQCKRYALWVPRWHFKRSCNVSTTDLCSISFRK